MWSTAASRPTWAPARTQEIEEERRLLYVAMTRAKDHLHLMVPQRFYTQQQPRSGDRHVYAIEPFHPGSAALHFERCAWPLVDDAGSATSAQKKGAAAMIDVAARARALWL